jgi:hypothetical protein
MLLVGDSDEYFYDEMWRHLDSHVQNCWLPGMLNNCSHWCPQDRHAPRPRIYFRQGLVAAPCMRASCAPRRLSHTLVRPSGIKH